VVFNANPLLRYDGYYMLSDFLEIPNLAQKSQLSLINRLRTVCLGMDPVPARFLPERNQTMFAAYSVLSFLYRWFVYFSIMWFLTKVFKPYGLEILGYTMISMALIGIIVVPGYRLFKFFNFPGRWRQVKKPRLLASAVVAAVVLVGIAWIPVPHNVYAPFVIRPDQAEYVYVTVPGQLQSIDVEPGQRVSAGDRIVALRDWQLELELEQMRGERQALIREIESREMVAGTSPESVKFIGELRARLAAVSDSITLHERSVAKLSIHATTDGVVFPPPETSPAEKVMQEVAWARTPLDPENLGAVLQPQTMICAIGNPQRMKAVLLIEQSDVQFVQADQPVQLMLDEFRGQRIAGSVSTVSRNQLVELPRELSTTHGGPVGSTPGMMGEERPQLTYFEAIVPMPAGEYELLPGFRGTAKVRVGQASLGWRFLRLLRTVFFFR
jgi:putative peptide zinc metalloprotease protein